jgi:hypothetical protein
LPCPVLVAPVKYVCPGGEANVPDKIRKLLKNDPIKNPMNIEIEVIDIGIP